MGGWKDSVCDWAALLFFSLCCPAVAIGQVMDRMNLDCLATPLYLRGAMMRPCAMIFWITEYSACVVLSWMTAIHWILTLLLLSLYLPHYDDNDDEDSDYFYARLFVSLLIIHLTYSAFFGIYLFFIICKTRGLVRRKFYIKEECCPGCEDWCCPCEDCCCVWYFRTWSILQLSRHNHATSLLLQSHGFGAAGAHCVDSVKQHAAAGPFLLPLCVALICIQHSWIP
jgi:hypothetical protein